MLDSIAHVFQPLATKQFDLLLVIYLVAITTEAMSGALAAGRAEAVLLPMANAVALRQDSRTLAQGLASTVVQDPELAGDAALGVNPRDRALLDKLNDAIDEIKRDGRFDRINTRFIPFRLQ